MQTTTGKQPSSGYLVPVLVAVAYFLAARWGLQLASLHGNVSPVWPASGVAIAALIYGGLRWWPAVAAGAFAANALTAVSLGVAGVIAVGNTLEAVLGAFIFMQIQSRVPLLGKFSEAAGFTLMSLAAPVVAACVGVGCLHVVGAVGDGKVAELLLTWWAGDAIGALVFAPALLALRRPECRLQCLLKLAAFALLLAVYASWINGIGFDGAQIFLMFPLLLLATWWFGGDGAKVTAALLVAFTVTTMAMDQHLFVAQSLNQSLLLLELFLTSLAFTGLLLSAFQQTGPLLLPGAVMASGWLISGLLFTSLEQQRFRLDAFRFETLVHDSEGLIKGRLETYVDALRGAASFQLATDKLDRRRWMDFARALDITRLHPGINGIGVVTPLRRSDVDDFVARMMADGAEDFAIKAVPDAGSPSEDAEGYIHYVITYIEPLGPNRQALGLDLASEGKRAAAARSARDSGQATITDRITLVQDGKRRPGFLLYYPVYQQGLPLATAPQRQAAFIGWIYAPFITENFLGNVLGGRAEQISMHVYDGDAVDTRALLFASSHHDDENAPADHFDRVTRLRLLDKDYTIGWHRGRGFRPAETFPAMIAGSSLALVSTLLAGLVLSLQTLSRRAGEIVESRTRELRELNAKLEGEVTERTRAESEARAARQAAEAANSAKSEFLATMSHEIRTPMNSVIGYTDLLLNSPVSDEQRIWLSNIQTSGRALLALINDILDFSKIEAGRLELESIPFSPEGVAREVVSALAPKASEGRLTLSTDVENEIPRLVLGDPARFRQVLTNLVANSVKFTESGFVRLGLSWHGRDEQRGVLSVVVQDSGIGIAEEKLKNLFTKFTQADSSTTRRYGGTGLGLAICKELVGLMGGAIAVHSVAGKGTSIGFELPFQRSSAEAPSPEGRLSGDDFAKPSKAAETRVLLAEDTLMNQRLAVAVLRRLGCVTDLAANGREAVEKFSNCRYDIVYMDCQMPVMDGFDASREIRRIEKKDARGGHIPIIAVTANALTGDRDRCLEAGMDDYISKPFTIADFARTLGEWVEGRRG